MRLLLGSLFALVVAAVVGLGATYLALTRGAAFGPLTIGSWTAWPKTGTADADADIAELGVMGQKPRKVNPAAAVISTTPAGISQPVR